MTNTIRILNNATFAEITTVNGIINPVVYEEINASYTFSFEVDYRYKSLFTGDNIIDVEGQYFRPVRVNTNRGFGVSVSVDCEHVSYDLIDEEDETEEYEGTAAGMFAGILNGTQFSLGSVVHTAVDYYKPSSNSVRQRLFDIANLFGTELIFDNFTVDLVYRRGVNNNQKFELGENLISVREEIDNTNGTAAYDIDVVDLSEVPGYEFLMSIGLGDTVEVIDPLAGVNTVQRVLSREYNPFTKINPRVQIGNLIRDFTDYIREEKEEEVVEDPTANYLLGTFKVGQIDCLQLSGIEMSFESLLPDDVSAGVDYFVEGEHKGVSITLKSQYSNYYATVTKFYEDGSYTDFDLSSVNMQSWNLPEKNLVALTVAVSQVPWNEVDLDVHKAAIYGVVFNKAYIDPLRELKIGKHNILNMNALIDTNGEKLELEDFSATLDYHLMQEYEGVKLSLNNEFKDYTVTIMTFSSDGIPTVYDYATVKDQLATWKLPRENAEFLLVSISEVPSAQFNPAIHKSVQYGIKFEKVPFEALSQLKVGDVECLYLSGVMLSPNPKLNEIQAEVFYKEMEELNGLKLTLKREYRNYYVSVTTRNKKGKATTHSYDEIMGWNFPNENATSIVIQVLEKPPGEFNSSLHRQAWYGFKFVEQSDEPIDGDYGGVSYYIESETVKATGVGAQFDFTVPYDAVVSVTLGVGQIEQIEPVTAYWSLIKDVNEMAIGVSVDVKGLASGEVDVSVQAVCQEGVLEEEGEPGG